jgi:4-carboxymuconolactone decarboxylase
MTDKAARRARGELYFRKNYADMMEPPPEGQDPFFDIMLDTLFSEVWSREEQLSLRDRRLFTMGIIAAMGEADVFGIQCSSALRRGELDEAQVRELVIHAAPYAGYPRVGRLRASAEQAISQHHKTQKKSASTDEQ